MFRKKIKYYFFMAFLLLVIGACDDDLLDVKSNSIIDNNDIENNPEMAENLFLSSYSELYDQIINIDTHGPRYFGWNALCDEGMDNAPVWSGVNAYTKPGGRGYGFVYTYNHQNEIFWPYKEINSLNSFINQFSKSENKEILSTVGEAYFLRAYLYFELVRRYGGVPIITDDVNKQERLTRNTEKETWDFILTDLDKSIANIVKSHSSTVKDKDRANRYTAFALKSRAMLYAGTIARYGGGVQNDGLQGLNSADAENYFKLAYVAADSVQKSAKYELYNKFPGDSKNYQYIFLDENNPEVIYQIDHSFPGNGHSYDGHMAPYRFRNGWGTETVPLLEFVESYEYTDGTMKPFDYTRKYNSVAEVFEGKDLRMDATILRGGSKWQGQTMKIHRETRVIETDGTTTKYSADAEWKLSPEHNSIPGFPDLTQTGVDGPINVTGGWDITRTGFYVKKYLDPDKILEDDQSWQNQILIRYAEVLLNKAEAAAELGGAYAADGLIALNEVRSRANLPAKSSLTINNVRHERKIELAFELHRFWDLRRWRIGTQVLDNKMFNALNPIQWIDKTKTPAEIHYTIEKVAPGNHLSARLYNVRDNYCPISTRLNPGMVQNIGW